MVTFNNPGQRVGRHLNLGKFLHAKKGAKRG